MLNMGNKILREIRHFESSTTIWSMLNKLYIESFLLDRIYGQLRFYTFKMSDFKGIDENVDDYLKLVTNLNNLQVEMSEDVQAILPLSSLSHRYDQLKEALKYGRDTLNLIEITGDARLKEQ